MNKTLLTIVITLVILIVAGFGFLAWEQASAPAKNQTESAAQPETVTSEEGQNVPGAYRDYSEEAIATTDGTRILFFHAPWCPQCRELDASIRAGAVPAGVTIFKTDYDSNQALRQKYGVTIQTTLVRIDDKGELVDSYVAYDQPQLAAIVEHLLP